MENAITPNARPGASATSSVTLGMLKDMQRKAMEDEELEKGLVHGTAIKSNQKASKDKPAWSLRLSLKTETSKLAAKFQSA